VDAERRIAELEAQLVSKDQLIAELRAELAAKDARLAELERKVAALVEQLGQNSTNSNRPPSGDGPAARAERGKKRKKAKGTRRQGGQPKHRGTHRELLPAGQVDDFVDFFPSHCENCCKPLPETLDPSAKRYQMTELPAFEPHTTEYRRHAVRCPCCRHTTRAPYDHEAIPASPFGPRLMSVVALLTGVYHLSRRKTVDLLSDIVGVRISLGAVSAVEARVTDAVEQPVHDAWRRVAKASVKHTDGTTWLQGGITLSLWTIATAVATVFKIVANGRMETLKPLFGSLRGILVSDRATALGFWAMERRQICWAHLLRKFVSFAERDGPAGTFGRELLDYTGIIFEYWHDYRDGKLCRETFRAWMIPVREQVEALLERAAASGPTPLAGSCADMLAHRAALWTFVDQIGVEPTNNHAERELRGFVLWRKRSFGSQSERGNRFAERLMTIAHTARKQKKNVLEFLTACCVARVDGGHIPSLFEPELGA
jgi:transposase